MFWSASVPAEAGATVLLQGPEGHHAAAVRRVALGELVRVTDGRGAYAEGPVVAVGRRSIEVAVELHGQQPAPALRLTVVQAVPKVDRSRLAVETLVEVGVDRVLPWSAERSQVRAAAERGERLVARWRTWAHEAGKQARRSWFCEVGGVVGTAEVASLLTAADVGFVLHEDATVPLGSVPLPGLGEVVLVVGPEGGIGADELATLLGGQGLATQAVRLGGTVLRTSTAGAVAAGVVLAGTRWR